MHVSRILRRLKHRYLAAGNLTDRLATLDAATVVLYSGLQLGVGNLSTTEAHRRDALRNALASLWECSRDENDPADAQTLSDAIR